MRGMSWLRSSHMTKIMKNGGDEVVWVGTDIDFAVF